MYIYIYNVYKCVHVYICMYVCLYIYIERDIHIEREREKIIMIIHTYIDQ